MKFLNASNFVLIITILNSVVADISASDLYDWATTSLTLTQPQSIMVLTAGIAYETTTMLNVWDRCYTSSGYFVNARDCHDAIRRATVRWMLGLAALGKITGWWKRDFNSDSPAFQDISLGGLEGVYIDIKTLAQSDLVKRDDGVIEFTHGENAFRYEAFMYDDLLVSNADMVLFGNGNDTNVPLMMLEANNNGTWLINILQPDLLEKRYGDDSDLYIRGQGGLVIECQYGAGSNYDSGSVDAWLTSMVIKQGYDHLLHATYNVYHGYVGDNSRLKCATKLYSTDQNYDSWRDWGDVWNAF